MQDTAHSHRKMTTDEFLVWAEAQPKEAGRFELWDGRIIEKHGAAGTKNGERSQHWEMKAALYRALFSAVKDAGLEAHVAINGPGVPLSDDTTPEPDVLVYLGPKVPRDSLVVPEPVIVCEILSPANAQHDLIPVRVNIDPFHGLYRPTRAGAVRSAMRSSGKHRNEPDGAIEATRRAGHL